MAVLLMPPLSIQFIDSSGVPLAFGKVYTAKAGTTAGPGQAYPQATYTDSTETTTNTNPIVLDATGSATLWLDGYYSMAVYNATGSLVRSADNVSSSSPLNPLVLQQALYTTAAAGGSSDAITAAFTPVITTTTLASGNTFLTVRAGFANTTTTPTFTPNSGAILPKTIVKANGQALAVGDIPGAGFWMQLQYDSTSGEWVLLNPATGGTSVVGTARNLRASIYPASTSINFSADEVILETALGGTAYKIANLNKTLNMAGGPGAGYMDTGAAGPVSGYCAIYAIYNPTTQTVALLGYNATSVNAPNVYGGANMPTGYTASALLSVWGTNASSQFKIGSQIDRTISFVVTPVLNTSTQQLSYTPLNISGVIPLNAKFVSGYMFPSSPAIADQVMRIASDANSSNEYLTLGNNVYGISGPFSNLPLTTPQILYYVTYTSSGILSAALSLSQYII